MSLGNRLHQLAVRGCLIAACLLLVVAPSIALSPAEGQKPPAKEAQSDRQSGAPEHQGHSRQREQSPANAPLGKGAAYGGEFHDAADSGSPEVKQIGRASCRERVCQYV